MSERKQFRAIKGTRDILPPDSSVWNWFEQTARDVFESFNFDEIRPPIFEETSLFARSIGAATDVVSKEMFTFWDPFDPEGWYKRVTEELGKGGRDIASALLPDPANPDSGGVASLTLRPEATASVVRAYIEHGMHRLPGNQKLYYMGPMFRRERPQKGRYRQFYQIGAEVLGPSDAPSIDAELIEMLFVFFRRVGLGQANLFVNSIGCQQCRPAYVELLREELRKQKVRFGPDSQLRIETNPLRVLDSKLPEEQPVIEQLPRISDHLCEACREHFAKLRAELTLRAIPFEENWRLVRGLDYYSRTTFEVTAAHLGSQNAVSGGGRYDGLVELLGGPPTKGIGFAIGSDRALLSIKEAGNPPPVPGLSVFVAWLGAASYPAAVAIARQLRDRGVRVELPAEGMKFKKSLGLADKLGARYALILGDEEVAAGNYTLKRLADAEQKRLSASELLEYLESERRGSCA